MTGNCLKIIALVAMTIDHVGMMLFPHQEWMRIIGRIAFPIFTYMIAEGCRYTKNRKRYVSQIALLGVAMQIVLFIVDGSLYQSVFISFTLAILLIYIIDKAKQEKNIEYWVGVGLAVFVIIFLCFGLPNLLPKTDFTIDYGIVGIAIPVGCYFAESKRVKVVVFTLGLIVLAAFYGGVQWFGLLAVPFIVLYNNQKGRYRLKNLFYFYYPIHLGVIYVIDALVNEL